MPHSLTVLLMPASPRLYVLGWSQQPDIARLGPGQCGSLALKPHSRASGRQTCDDGGPEHGYVAPADADSVPDHQLHAKG